MTGETAAIRRRRVETAKSQVGLAGCAQLPHVLLCSFQRVAALQLALIDHDATFEDSVPESVAARYRRLANNRSVAEVLAKLRRHGCPERDREVLLRSLARIPDDWSRENEPWPHAVIRRAGLARKLRSLADDIASDPDLGGLSFGIHTTYLNGPPGKGMVMLAQLLRDQATHLTERDGWKRVRMADGSIFSLSEFEQRFRPARKPAPTPYTLRTVFDLLQSCIPRQSGREPRALNREVEILAGVLLDKFIPPGTLTQLRKKERRRYVREKQ